MKIGGAIVALFALAFTCGQAQAVNLVTNGSFETPVITPPNQFTTFNGGSSFTGWTVGGNSVDIVGTVFPNIDGPQKLDLSGEGAGSVSQTLATTPGQVYLLDFQMTGNYGSGPTLKTFNVLWGGNLIASPSFNITGHNFANPGWTELQYFVTATSASTTLSFQSTTPGGYGPYIDAVSVNAAPEPGTAALICLGSALLLKRSKRAV